MRHNPMSKTDLVTDNIKSTIKDQTEQKWNLNTNLSQDATIKSQSQKGQIWRWGAVPVRNVK